MIVPIIFFFFLQGELEHMQFKQREQPQKVLRDVQSYEVECAFYAGSDTDAYKVCALCSVGQCGRRRAMAANARSLLSNSSAVNAANSAANRFIPDSRGGRKADHSLVRAPRAVRVRAVRVCFCLWCFGA